MSKVRTGLLIGVLSAIGVLLLAIGASERKSPGPISTVHGRIADLEGGAACSGCHGGWFGDMQSACIECHGDIQKQVADGSGLHGSVSPELVANCASCHGEHHGHGFQLVNALGFSLAGVPDRKQFDHRQVGWAMDGAHTALACAECHPNADAELVPEGQKRFLGLSKDCASCHADPHGGAMQFACATCHSQSSFGERFVASHDTWLPLRGAHAGVDCRQCHATGTVMALESLHPGARDTARQCADCHATPHSPQFLEGNAKAAGQPGKAVCATCHPLDYESFQDLRATVTADQHAHGGFPLSAPHDQVACAMCHLPGSTYAERHTGRTATNCRACHQDPHGGQFDTGPWAATGCVGCHATTHFEPHGFDREHHGRTSMPLDGKHAEADCAECHKDPAEGEPRRFHGTQNRCEQCHADAHAAAFEPAAVKLAGNPRGACAECHATGAFADVDHTRFDHGRWTGFTVSGAHAQVECTDCHRRAEEPDHTGRRFGRIPRHGSEFGGCVVCHADPHAGIFDRPGAPATTDGRAGCERCHDTVSFRALPHGFDHGAFAGFPLSGVHGALACSSCHAAVPGASAAGRIWGKARGRECVDCHKDPHQGQFERLGRTDCQRCHKSATSFATLSFRHNLDSRFPLGDAHSKVACAGCHKPEPIKGVTAVRYKPLPVECVECHGTEGGGASGRRRRQ